MNPRLESLLNRWIDGELAPPEAEAVERMLAEDAEARRVCYELLMVDRLLDERIEGRSENIIMMDSIARDVAGGGGRGGFRIVALIAALAAVVALSLVGLFPKGGKPQSESSGPLITGSPDSRITIAQRQDASHWAVGELLRLERGTADIRLARHITANLEGPAAVELLDTFGNVRLLEGTASFESVAGGVSEVHVPGGILRNLDSRFITEVLTDGGTNVSAASGILEIRPRGADAPTYVKSGEALRLDPDGKTQSIRLPDHHFRSGLPQHVALFREDFDVADGAVLAGRQPSVGEPWEVRNEVNPTLIRKRRLDTSSGARKLVAKLAPHDDSSPRTVYIFSFDLLPPEWIHDKVKRAGGLEHISLLDGSGDQVVSISARASNSHRWQLVDERSKAASALTPVCALWTHSLTLCYGMDGLVTLHDGATAQAPIIAELRVADPTRVSGILIGNWDGGDLALSGIEAALLPGPTVRPQ